MAVLTFSFLEVILTASALLLAYVWFLNRKKVDPRFPPGPKPLPIIGNLHQLGGQPQKAMIKFAEEYGPCFSAKMGMDQIIVLNDPKLIKNVFAEISSTGRTANPVFLAFANGNYGVVFAEGIHWEQQRRFTLRTLRDFGFAKTAMEGMLLAEANSMLKYFEKHLNIPTTGCKIFNGPVVNSLWHITSGERHEWDAPEQPPVLKHAEEIITSLNFLNKSGLISLPFLRFIAPETMGWTSWLSSVNGLASLCNASKEEHRAKLNTGSPHDLIDHYLVEMDNETDPSSSFYRETGEKNLAALLLDLFVAGSETTSHSLSWTLLFLAHHPEVQKKLQDELDSVVGPGRQPSVSDKPNLPYTEATIMEVLRRTSVVNFGVPHRMIDDAVIDGYFFPKNTTIFSNIWYVHNDPKIWGDPQNFRPERFLYPDGKRTIRHDAFLPFSLGRRQCLGKSLAEDTLFLFTTCIFQKFNISPDPASSGEELNSVEPTSKLINSPEDFNIIITLRTEE